MLFFKKKKPAPRRQAARTQALSLIQFATHQEVTCRGCGVKLNIAGLPALELVECPQCNQPVFIPGRIDHYWLYKFIGRGGMGVVYKAVSAEFPEEKFAVKLIPEEAEEESLFVWCLTREAEVLRVFYGHPNIASLVEFGMIDDVYYLVTDYIPGKRLDYIVEELGTFSETQAISLALELLNVEKFICGKGYLYRDLKPENIMIKANFSPVLVDFGLTQSMNEAFREVSGDQVDGAPHYLPPERATGELEREYSEIYSLGMVLYFAVTGQTFFASGPAQEVMQRHVFDDRSGSLLPDMTQLSPEFCDIIHKMIAPRPVDRFQSFERLEKQLRQLPAAQT